MKGKKAKPPFFSARRLSESLCLPRSCRCLHVGLDWWIYMFSILVEDTGEQGKHKSDHLAPQRSSRAFENTKSPLMLERDSSGHHCCTHEVLQSTLRTFLFCFFFSRKRGWGYVTNAEKKKKNLPPIIIKLLGITLLTPNQSVPDFLFSAQVHPWTQAFSHGTILFCGGYVTLSHNTGPGWHKLSFADKNIHC